MCVTSSACSISHACMRARVLLACTLVCASLACTRHAERPCYCHDRIQCTEYRTQFFTIPQRRSRLAWVRRRCTPQQQFTSQLRGAMCMKAGHAMMLLLCYFNFLSLRLENHHKYCMFVRRFKTIWESPSAYLPDGEAILIIEGILPGWGSCIALSLGWPLRLLQTSVTRPYNFW